MSEIPPSTPEPDVDPAPENPMARAEDLFQKGDYASAGRIARQVKEAGDEEARARAHTLLERLPPSPLAKYLLLLTLLLLIAVTVFAYGN